MHQGFEQERINLFLINQSGTNINVKIRTIIGGGRKHFFLKYPT